MKKVYKAGELAIFIPRYVSDERKKFIEEKIREEKEKAEKLKLEKEQNKNL